LGDHIQDDGFIYFRIAENAAHGFGPVFNPGERVDAATSPVWMWLLAASARLGFSLDVAASSLGIVAAFGAILLCALWALELGAAANPAATAAALLGALLLAADDRFLSYAFSGMETPLCAVAWLWGVRALVRAWIQKVPTRGAGWWALLAALVRPEFVLLVAGVGLVALVRRSARPVDLMRTLLPALVVGGAYLAVHTAYFGSPVPNTWYAKKASDWAHARIGLSYVAGFVRAYPWVPLILVALFIRSLRAVGLALVVALLLFVAHVARLGGDHFEFHRVFLHVLPVAGALLGASAARIAAAPVVWRRVALSAVGFAILVHAGKPRVQPQAFEWVRYAARLGATLAQTYPADTRLGLFALGATGYTSGLPVVDALGIADPHVARRDLSHEHVCHLDIGHERGDPQYVLERADVVVFFAAYAPVRFESLDEIRQGFYSHKKFVAAAKDAVANGAFVLRNIEFGPRAYWAVLERRSS
jgi:hypothetical protein